MGGDAPIANFQAESADAASEQLDGELDAAIVFMAACVEAERAGRAAFAEACRADARDGYATVMRRLPAANLTSKQRRHLEAKLVRVRQMLERPRAAPISATHEAA
jgi:hypothetical protein